MIPDDIIICRCGRIHFVRGKDYQEAIEADQELLLICGNCHADDNWAVCRFIFL